MNDIKIMERSVFAQFGYGEFIGAICSLLPPICVHQLSSFQCGSVTFLDFP